MITIDEKAFIIATFIFLILRYFYGVPKNILTCMMNFWLAKYFACVWFLAGAIFLVFVTSNLLISQHPAIKNKRKEKYCLNLLLILVAIVNVLFGVANISSQYVAFNVCSYFYIIDSFTYLFHVFYNNYFLHDIKVKYIVVLGAGVSRGGLMSEMMKNRMDKLIQMLKEKKNKPIIILSGGNPHSEIEEAQLMYQYLEKNISGLIVHKEGNSRCTEENVRFTKIILSKQNIELERGCVITTNFHVPRTMYYLKKSRLNAFVVSSSVNARYLFKVLPKEYSSFILL